MLKTIREWYISRLIKKLGHPSDRVGGKAEQRLVWLGRDAIREVQPLANHPNPQVRYRAVWILGKSRDPDFFETIVSKVGDPDHRVAYDAILALGELRDPRAIPHLQALPERHQDHPDGLESAALMALAKLGITRETE